MQTVQFLIRNNRLNCVATFRSNDMLMAWGANAYGLSELMQVVADGTYVDVGFLETYSISAHIYYNRDSTTLDKVLVE
jgi:thymidylate synthase